MKEYETFINEFSELFDTLFSKNPKYFNERERFVELLIPVESCKIFSKIFNNNNDCILNNPNGNIKFNQFYEYIADNIQYLQNKAINELERNKNIKGKIYKPTAKEQNIIKKYTELLNNIANTMQNYLLSVKQLLDNNTLQTTINNFIDYKSNIDLFINKYCNNL